MKRKLCGIFIGLMMFGFSVHAAEYYVDCNAGDDSNAGTIDAPFATIQKATSIDLQPGDIVTVMPGVYYGSVNITAKGTKNNPIVFRANSRGENVTVITGANKDVREKNVLWTCCDEENNIWVIDYEVAENANIGNRDTSTLVPARVICDDVDIMAHTNYESLVSGVYSQDDSTMKYYPAYKQGYYYDKPEKKLYIKLRTDGKYGSSNPNEHCIKIAPSMYRFIVSKIDNSSVEGGYRGDAMGEDSFNICVGEYDGANGTGEAAESAYVVIDGFTLETPGYAGVFLRSSDVTVRNCYFRGCRTGVRGAARTRWADKIFSKNIIIEHCDWSELSVYDEAIELISECSDSDKTDYRFADIEASGYSMYKYFWWQRKNLYPDMSYEVGGFTNNMGENWTIRYNYIHDCFDGISYRGMQMYSDTPDGVENPVGSKYIEIYGNVFENCLDNAIETEEHARNVYIHDNYFHNIPDAISVQPGHGIPWPTNIKIYRNVMHNTRDFNDFFRKTTGLTPKTFKIMIDKNTNWNSTYTWMNDYPLTSDGKPSKIDFEDEGIKIFNNTIVMPGGGLLNGLGSGVWSVPHINIQFVNNAVVCDVVCETPDEEDSAAQFDISYLKDADFKNNFFATDSRMIYSYSDRFLQEGNNQIVNSNEMNFNKITRLKLDPTLNEGSILIGAGWKDRHEPGMSRDVGALRFGETFDVSSAGCEQ